VDSSRAICAPIPESEPLIRATLPVRVLVRDMSGDCWSLVLVELGVKMLKYNEGSEAGSVGGVWGSLFLGRIWGERKSPSLRIEINRCWETVWLSSRELIQDRRRCRIF